MSDTVTLWACTDCLYELEFDEDFEDMRTDDQRKQASATRASFSNGISPGLMRCDHDCNYEMEWQSGECTCERIEFTWSPCDVCGSPLGGERHAYTGRL